MCTASDGKQTAAETATKLPDQISIHLAEAFLPFQGPLHKQHDVIHGLPINTRKYKCHVLVILVASNRRTVHDSKYKATTHTSLIWFPFALLSHSLTVTASSRSQASSSTLDDYTQKEQKQW